MINIKTRYEIEQMKTAGRIVFEVLELLKEKVEPGITTKELDRIATNYIIKCGAFPSFKGVKGSHRAKPFPAAICTSINDEVIHGIPGNRVLKEGDIISIDVGALYNGYHGDAARTYPVGKCSEEALRLIEVTQNSFFEGIKKAYTGNRIIDISGNIQDYVEKNGFSVVREFTGHGIGKELHEGPEIPNYRSRIPGPRLVSGMSLAIEPMVNAGMSNIRMASDHWTVLTADGKFSAHYENTVIITDNEPILTTLYK
ncbi:MAG TPA: type I methionyl aminopeptidase [Clostridiaceae bacterium]|jgi:methionyl aminopeptidase|nr:type I methionyl aminopeptidase [Clostridiaceae bacterium]HOA32018.1 type I methionyl aminopeptidase [Clostridia bacterium]